MNTIVDRADLLSGLEGALKAVEMPVVAYLLTRSRVDHTWWDALVDATGRLARATWVLRYAWAWGIVVFDASDGVQAQAIGAALVQEMRARSVGGDVKCFLKHFRPTDTAEHVIRTMDDAVQAVEDQTLVGSSRLL